MDSPWTVHGSSMDWPWTVPWIVRVAHVLPMDSPWTTHGQPMSCARAIHGTVHGQSMDSP
eukprot:3478918-Lingulodinium_polyedra.AAC.1